METIQSVFAPVTERVHAVTSSMRATYDRWVDPSEAVATEMAANEILKSKLVARSAALTQAREAAALEAAQAADSLVAAKQGHVARAQSKLDAIDALSVAKMIYDEIEATAGKFADQIRHAGQKELQGYGYQSKMLISLGIAMEATRDAIVAGAPFEQPLNALAAELNDAQADEVTSVIAALRPFQAEGLRQPEEIVSSSRQLCAAISAGHMASAAAAAVAAASVKPDPDSSIFAPKVQGWLKMVRFEAPSRIGGTQDAERDQARAQRSAETQQRQAADAVVSAAKSYDWDALLAALPPIEQAPSTPEVAALAANVRKAAEGRLVADTTLRFADAMMSVRRFAFIEGLISPQ